MIPEWMPNGDLPPGVHMATLSEIESRLAFNPHRKRLLAGLLDGCEELRRAGCGAVYLDGSFVSSKIHPADFDACWAIQGVDDSLLDPIFFDFSNGRAAQKARFWGEFFPAELPGGGSGRSFLAFFQVNKGSGEPKGILQIRLRRRVKRKA